jgi:hypothetical protein
MEIDDFLENVAYDYDGELLYPTDLKDAVIGTMEFFDGSNGVIERIVLDKMKCIDILVTDILKNDEDCTSDEALEMAYDHFYYNVLGSYVDGVPAYVTLLDNM